MTSPREKRKEPMSVKDKLLPENATEALAWWDAGESVFTVEMGGLGPGYEQAIHVTVFEILSRLLTVTLPEDKDKLNDLLDEAAHGANRDKGLRLSGAQAGAAKSLAYQYLIRPWQEVLNEVESDRRIQVSKNFP